MDLLGRERQHHLARAAELAEPLKDQPDRLPQTDVRIKAETDLSMPDIADRHADPQLAAKGLGTGGFEHPCAEHAEFELADAALHAQEQSVVGATWVVNTVQVDDTGFD
jgi:hypothetical protein